MSHFRVIEISLSHVPVSRTREELNIYEDHLFLSRSDWGGEPVDDYGYALERIKDELRKVATVNRRKRTIRFRSRNAVKNAYLKSLNTTFRKHKARLKEGVCRHYELRHAIDDICGIGDLFHTGYCQTGGQLIEDYLNGYLPQTVHIGTIIDAHF